MVRTDARTDSRTDGRTAGRTDGPDSKIPLRKETKWNNNHQAIIVYPDPDFEIFQKKVLSADEEKLEISGTTN